MLLWHGSASVNFLSILNQGLKTPKSLGFNYGGMFGSGIYFADLFQKS